ncbi:AAA domain-containing protein [Halobacteria archaeon AArc-m2/3/4]|uniref:AAA domain-containing protein n=1 Tax=Natronoglomus mannanivorans TaxID=2979990 RepID=A0ABT2Q879_9EURY|nr:AAA domain-containing protein [Halobacteria archaeon AArc-m2/3/4]
MEGQVQPQDTTSTTKTEVFDKLREKVTHERQIEREKAIQTLTEHSTNELKYLEDTPFIPGAEITRSTLTPPDVLSVEIPVHPQTGETANVRDEYGLYQGNEVLLQGKYEGEDVQATGIIKEIKEHSIHVRVTGEAAGDLSRQGEIAKSSNSSIGGMLNPVTYDRQLDAVEYAQNHPIASILTGSKPVQFSHQFVANTRELDKDLYRNKRQKEGIEKALNAEILACLQGPPGTGKTRVIVELARRLVLADKRVLITAETNAAVDNILIGSSDKFEADTDSLLHYHLENEIHAARTNLDGEEVHSLAREHFADCSPEAAEVVASTNSSSAKLGIDSFDYVIIDEATQASIPSSLIPIVRGEITILVGDHKQLPPFSQLQNKTQESLFERLYAENGLYGPDIGTRFNIQYRMDEKIAEFPSREFYEGDLKTAGSAGNIRGQLDMLPMGIFEVNGDYEEGGMSKFNPKEAEHVERMVKMLRKKGLQDSEIGVAAAHRKQAEHIKDRLNQAGIGNLQELRVNTFDSFQGSERDAMILSFTRSNERGNIGFLGDEIGRRRLNVAMTRAKTFCALIGDWDTLREGSNLYERLYQYVDAEIAPAKKVTL